MTKEAECLTSERELLGAVLMAADRVLPGVAPLVATDDFYHPAHRAIWEAITSLDLNREPVDPLTVAQRLESLGSIDRLRALGGARYLDELVGNCISVETAEYHTKAVSRKAERRRWHKIAAEISAKAAGDSDDEEFFSEAGALALGLTQQRRGVSIQSAKQGLRQLVLSVQERYEAFRANKPVSDIRTGFTGFDALTLGMRPGQLVIIAARPGMGKSAILGNILDHASADGVASLVFSLEMSAAETWTRHVVTRGLAANRLRTGNMTQRDWIDFTRATSTLADRPLFVDDVSDCGMATALEIRSRARRWRSGEARDHQRVIIAVDYLQLVDGSGTRGEENRAAEVGKVSRSLKALAKELACPVIALAQLNRSCEARQNKRPMASDLRESGQIEQDADVIAFLYRDEVYNANTDDRGIAELIVAKNRDGGTATIKLSWEESYVRFGNIEGEYK